MSSCKSCGAQIEWVRTESGKAMPLDIDPVDDGNLVVVGGVASKWTPELDAAGIPPPRRVSHFVTCPNAGDWRKPR
jgi:hypothetical protein